MNREVYDSMSPWEQKIIEVVSGETNSWNHAQFLSNHGFALQRLIAAGVQTFEFPQSVWSAFGEGAQAVMDENMSDPLFKKIFDSFHSSLVASAGWISKSSAVYTRERNRVMGI